MRILLLVVFLIAVPAFAQDVSSVEPDSPPRIIVTPRVVPPPESIESGLGGNIRVLLTVDERGDVVSADDVTGPGFVCRGVTRADVVAMRNAAKEAAMQARFTPATRYGRPVVGSIWLNFDFPGQTQKSVYSAKSESNFEAEGTDKGETKPSPSTGQDKYTIKGDINYSAANAPPPDYKGPVNTGGSGSNAADPRAIPKQIAGGVLNGKAVSLPKPPYPPAARAVRASGAVSVQVLIDEEGKVFSAQAISGHPLLRAASATAACSSEFSPTRLSGQPVKVSGVITYNFVP